MLPRIALQGLRLRAAARPSTRTLALTRVASTRSTTLRSTAYRSITTSSRLAADVSTSQSIDSIPPLSSGVKASSAPSPVPQTLTEKIVQRYSIGLPEGKYVKSGDYVTLSPHHCMTHDNSWPVATKFMAIGATKVHDPSQVVCTLDHDVQNKSENNLKKYKLIEEFAKVQGIDFYPAGRGIGHQIMVEEGYAWPGTVTVASDSHSNMYGGVGCLGTPMVRTDAASIWATGRTWWQIPPIAKVTLTGVLPLGVTGKDVIVALCGLFNNDEVLNHAIEFSGSEQTLRSLPIDDRLAIANMTTEWGALSGLFPIDGVLEKWLRARATLAALYPKVAAGAKGLEAKKPRFDHERIDELINNPLQADQGATYAKSLYLNLSTLSPYVSGPNSVKIATPLRDLEKQDIKVDKAYLVSCTNSRASDIAAAAKVFKDAGDNAKIAPGVKFYIAAASIPEQELAEAAGDWQTLLAAGAEPLPAGCGPCIGLGTGLLEAGEVGISASNRNFKGRMGSTDAKAYLASPEVVAASALNGKIAGPGWYEQPVGVTKVVLGEGEGNVLQDKVLSIEDALDKLIADAEALIGNAEADLGESEASEGVKEPESEEKLTEILPGFQEKIKGRILWCDADNVNTDGIYPGKYTYQDGITKEKMAEVVMENYDPEFASIAQEGDILVSGFNFGCGSSREQAATALLAKKVGLCVAGSFGNIFGRNSINNALMGVEVPKLISRLRETFKDGNKQLTKRTDWTFEWDLRRSKVIVTEGDGKVWEQKVGELPPNVQDIIAQGGLEKWVKKEIGA